VLTRTHILHSIAARGRLRSCGGACVPLAADGCVDPCSLLSSPGSAGGALMSCQGGCVPVNSSCPEGAMVTWYERGRTAYFDMTTGRRNVACPLCAGAVDSEGGSIDANVSPLNRSSFCGGPSRGQCRGLELSYCDQSEPSRPCPVRAAPVCDCKAGFAGVGCERQCPLGPDCGKPAGACAALGGSWVQCSSSSDCIPRPRATICSGHGQCSSGACVCKLGFGGSDCATTTGCLTVPGQGLDGVSRALCTWPNATQSCSLTMGMRLSSGLCTGRVLSDRAFRNATAALLPYSGGSGLAGRRQLEPSSNALASQEFLCLDGWFGMLCASNCPGLDAVTGVGSICGGHGRCDTSSSSESCVATAAAACAGADISSADPTFSKYMCLIAAANKCNYTAGVTEVLEACVATATWCAQVDVSAANAQALCMAAGGADARCQFTPAAGNTPATCLAVDQTACAGAVLGTSTCAAAGYCTYVPYVAPVTETCVATHLVACAKADIGAQDVPRSRAACHGAAPSGDCTYMAAKCVCEPCSSTNAAGVCVPDTPPACGYGAAAVCQKDNGAVSSVAQYRLVCECPGALSGVGCSTCLCQNGGVCNSITHECDCVAGFTGDVCERMCTREGACNGGGVCDPLMKQCKCDYGWLGRWCDLQLLEGVIDCPLPEPNQYIISVWDPAAGICARFADCSSPVCGAGLSLADAVQAHPNVTMLPAATGVAERGYCEFVSTPCQQGNMNMLGADTVFTNCSSPTTPQGYVVFQTPGEFVTGICQPGDMHTVGNDTALGSCSIRETPMQETRLRAHGSGNDGPIRVAPGKVHYLNNDRYSTTAEAGSLRLALHEGAGTFPPGSFALIHQTIARSSRDKCLAAAGGGGQCVFTPSRAAVEERCEATYQSACSKADISWQDVSVSSYACNRMGAGPCNPQQQTCGVPGSPIGSPYPFPCSYTQLYAGVVETCTATAAAACAAVDATAASGQSDCLAAGGGAGACGAACQAAGGHACTFTPSSGAAAATCAATDSARCTNAATGAAACNTAGACDHVPYDAPRVESCESLHKTLCESISLAHFEGNPPSPGKQTGDPILEPARRSKCETAGGSPAWTPYACKYTSGRPAVPESCTPAAGLAATPEVRMACGNYSETLYQPGTWEYAVVDRVAAAEGPQCIYTGYVWTNATAARCISTPLHPGGGGMMLGTVDNGTCLALGNSTWVEASNASCNAPGGTVITAADEANCTLTGNTFTAAVGALCTDGRGHTFGVHGAKDCPIRTGNTYTNASCVSITGANVSASDCVACTGNAACNASAPGATGNMWRDASCRRTSSFDRQICESPNAFSKQPLCDDPGPVLRGPAGLCAHLLPAGRWRLCGNSCVPRCPAATYISAKCETGGMHSVLLPTLLTRSACLFTSTGNTWMPNGSPNCTSSQGVAVYAADKASCVTESTGNVWYPHRCEGDTGSQEVCELTGNTYKPPTEASCVTSNGSAVQYLHVTQPLSNNYATGEGNKAQVVRVDEVTTVQVETLGRLTAHAWDGKTGGIMAFLATAVVEVANGASVDVDGIGYRGVPMQTGFAARLQVGDQGEGLASFGWEDAGEGPAKVTVPNNIAGGGGAKGSLTCSYGGGGGGGGHATVGEDGSDAGAPDSSPCAFGGQGGLLIGSPNQTRIFFGGAGGQGGADDDGWGSAGAAGGGILVAAVTGVDIAPGGRVSANGERGAYMYNAGGCGSGGGGGGAGGALHLRVDTATLRGGAMAIGGAGGDKTAADGKCGLPGGKGGLGRITVQQLQGTSAFPILVNQPIAADPSSVAEAPSHFGGRMFRPTFVSSLCQAGDMFAAGNDTKATLCKLDPYKMPTVELDPGTKTGCVVDECVEGYWNATGKDAKLFECTVPINQFVLQTCTKGLYPDPCNGTDTVVGECSPPLPMRYVTEPCYWGQAFPECRDASGNMIDRKDEAACVQMRTGNTWTSEKCSTADGARLAQYLRTFDNAPVAVTNQSTCVTQWSGRTWDSATSTCKDAAGLAVAVTPSTRAACEGTGTGYSWRPSLCAQPALCTAPQGASVTPFDGSEANCSGRATGYTWSRGTCTASGGTVVTAQPHAADALNCETFLTGNSWVAAGTPIAASSWRDCTLVKSGYTWNPATCTSSVSTGLQPLPAKRSEASCVAIVPDNIWTNHTCIDGASGRLLPLHTRDACEIAHSGDVWIPAANGVDTQFADCFLPAWHRWVHTPCQQGSILTKGNDTVIKECSEPVPGQYVAAVCVYGTWDTAGSDTLLMNCTDTADLAIGSYIAANCVMGSAYVLGADSLVRKCSLPVGECSAPDGFDAGPHAPSWQLPACRALPGFRICNGACVPRSFSGGEYIGVDQDTCMRPRCGAASICTDHSGYVMDCVVGGNCAALSRPAGCQGTQLGGIDHGQPCPGYADSAGACPAGCTRVGGVVMQECGPIYARFCTPLRSPNVWTPEHCIDARSGVSHDLLSLGHPHTLRGDRISLKDICDGRVEAAPPLNVTRGSVYVAGQCSTHNASMSPAAVLHTAAARPLYGKPRGTGQVVLTGACLPGAALAHGLDSTISRCTAPRNHEFVTAVCVGGDVHTSGWTTGHNTQLQECVEPERGQWTTATCSPGSWHTPGLDAALQNCTNTSEVPAGSFASAACEPGWAYARGVDTTIRACALPNDPCTSEVAIPGEVDCWALGAPPGRFRALGNDTQLAHRLPEHRCTNPNVSCAGACVPWDGTDDCALLGHAHNSLMLCDGACVPRASLEHRSFPRGVVEGHRRTGYPDYTTVPIFSQRATHQVVHNRPAAVGEFVVRACTVGSALAPGANSLVQRCAAPAEDEYVHDACVPGDHLGGRDTIRHKCAEPRLGEWVSEVCTYGRWDGYGRNTVIRACTDTAQIPAGSYIARECISGSAHVHGNDTLVLRCTLPNRAFDQSAALWSGLAPGCEHNDANANCAALGPSGRYVYRLPPPGSAQQSGACIPHPGGEYVRDHCVVGSALNRGSDSVLARCTEPGFNEFVHAPCIAGDYLGGADTIVRRCREPHPGEWVTSVCVAGRFDGGGRDTQLGFCTDACRPSVADADCAQLAPAGRFRAWRSPDGLTSGCVPGARRADNCNVLGGRSGDPLCEDDPAGVLAALGQSIYCSAVVHGLPLKSDGSPDCGYDLSTPRNGVPLYPLPQGTTAAQLCPRTCKACSPPPPALVSCGGSCVPRADCATSRDAPYWAPSYSTQRPPYSHKSRAALDWPPAPTLRAADWDSTLRHWRQPSLLASSVDSLCALLDGGSGRLRLCNGACVPSGVPNGHFIEASCVAGSALELGSDSVVRPCSLPRQDLGQYAARSCYPGSALAHGFDTSIETCSQPFVNATVVPVPSASCLAGVGSTCPPAGVSVGDWVWATCRAGSHLAGADTGRAACTHPRLGEFSAVACVPGNADSRGTDSVLRACSAVVPGRFVTAPCRRFGGGTFERSIYLPGRDTQQHNCTEPSLSEFAIVACQATWAASRVVSLATSRAPAPMEAWLRYNATEAGMIEAEYRRCTAIHPDFRPCHGACALGACAAWAKAESEDWTVLLDENLQPLSGTTGNPSDRSFTTFDQRSRPRITVSVTVWPLHASEQELVGADTVLTDCEEPRQLAYYQRYASPWTGYNEPWYQCPTCRQYDGSEYEHAHDNMTHRGYTYTSDTTPGRYTTAACYAGEAPYHVYALDTQFAACSLPYDRGETDNAYVARHCLPGRYFALGNDTALAPCSHPKAIDEWVATVCRAGHAAEDGADTYIRDCTRPGKGKWASPIYAPNGVMIHPGVCVAGTYVLAGMDSNLRACTMPKLWEYARTGCKPGSIYFDGVYPVGHAKAGLPKMVLDSGRDTVIEPCSAVPPGDYVLTPCRKFGSTVHEGGEDMVTTPCTAPGPGQYAAVPCEPGRGWPMAYGLLDGDPWDGYCLGSAYGYLDPAYCAGAGYGLRPTATALSRAQPSTLNFAAPTPPASPPPPAPPRPTSPACVQRQFGRRALVANVELGDLLGVLEVDSGSWDHGIHNVSSSEGTIDIAADSGSSSGSNSWSDSGSWNVELLPGTVTARLILDLDLASIALGSVARVEFESRFRLDVAYLLGNISSARVLIDAISAGSVVVDFSVLPDSAGRALDPDVLLAAFAAGGVPVAGHHTVAPVQAVLKVDAGGCLLPYIPTECTLLRWANCSCETPPTDPCSNLSPPGAWMLAKPESAASSDDNISCVARVAADCRTYIADPWALALERATAVGVAVPLRPKQSAAMEQWLVGAVAAMRESAAAECACAPGSVTHKPARVLRPPRIARNRTAYGGVLRATQLEQVSRAPFIAPVFVPDLIPSGGAL
jgi:hypothetical protein